MLRILLLYYHLILLLIKYYYKYYVNYYIVFKVLLIYFLILIFYFHLLFIYFFVLVNVTFIGSCVQSEFSTLPLVMHTSDLTHLYCWICSGETDLSDARETDKEAFHALQATRRRFVHACKCSLIAHENVGLLELTPVPPVMDSPAPQHASG